MGTSKSAGQRVIWLLATALLFSYPANSQSKRTEIRGIVRDEQEALIVGAGVFLASEHGLKLETVTDGDGSFKFGTQAVGRYRLRVSSIGFAEYEQELTFVDGGPVEAITVTLYPTIKESLVVESDALNSMLDADRAAGTTIIKGRELEALPDDPDRLAEQLQMIATSSGSAPATQRLPSTALILRAGCRRNPPSVQYASIPICIPRNLTRRLIAAAALRSKQNQARVSFMAAASSISTRRASTPGTCLRQLARIHRRSVMVFNSEDL